MPENDPHLLQENWLSRLQDSGYRLTSPLRAIVAVLVQGRRALSPIDVYDLGRQEYPRLGLVTVYRTLEKLEELGLVQRVHHHQGCHRYLRSAHGHEHLLVCTACGRVETFSGDDLTGLIEGISQRSGFTIKEHWLQLFGLCTVCRAKG